MTVHGLDIIGPFPKEIELVTVFSAGIPTSAKQPDAATALLKFLTTPDAARVFRAKGLDPV
jgi:molybdate transport system substrate-binding protein